MRTDLSINKPNTDARKLELVNTLAVTLGFAPCTDAPSFMALLDEKIDETKAELAKLTAMRDTAATLFWGRRRGMWAPGANTVCARVLWLLQQHGTLTRPQMADLLAAEAAGEVPLGSISAALSKLAEAGRIVGGRAGWKLKGAVTNATE